MQVGCVATCGRVAVRRDSDATKHVPERGVGICLRAIGALLLLSRLAQSRPRGTQCFGKPRFELLVPLLNAPSARFCVRQLLAGEARVVGCLLDTPFGKGKSIHRIRELGLRFTKILFEADGAREALIETALGFDGLHVSGFGALAKAAGQLIGRKDFVTGGGRHATRIPGFINGCFGLLLGEGHQLPGMTGGFFCLLRPPLSDKEVLLGFVQLLGRQIDGVEGIAAHRKGDED